MALFGMNKGLPFQDGASYWDILPPTGFRVTVGGAVLTITGAGTVITGSSNISSGGTMSTGAIVAGGNIQTLLYLCANSATIATNGAVYLAGTAQTPDSPSLCTGTASNSWILCEYADIAYDFAHAQQTTPTLFGSSQNQSTTQWWGLTHDGTNAILSSGAGDVFLSPVAGSFVRFGAYVAGAATDSTGYILINDAGGTPRKVMIQA
jgi:hypothetical protein